jgi:hypothetical protein
MSVPLHDPRPYLLNEDDTLTVTIGEVDLDGIWGGGFAHSDMTEQLKGEQLSLYRDARRDGYHPVLLWDLDTCVFVLEMRKHK